MDVLHHPEPGAFQAFEPRGTGGSDHLDHIQVLPIAGRRPALRPGWLRSKGIEHHTAEIEIVGPIHPECLGLILPLTESQLAGQHEC